MSNYITAREREMRQLLSEHEESGLSLSAFAEQHDLSRHSLYAWRRKIREKDAEASMASFVRVTQSTTIAPPSDQLEIHFESRVPCTIKIPAGCDQASLRQLIEAIQTSC